MEVRGLSVNLERFEWEPERRGVESICGILLMSVLDCIAGFVKVDSYVPPW